MLYKLMAYLFHGMVKGKVFNINVCERAARGSWKSPEWKEKLVDGTYPADLT